MKRPRHLSAEERALWDSVAKSAKPLRKPARIVEDKNAASPAAPPAPTPSRGKRSPPPDKPAAAKASLPPVLSIERRERSRLKRGQREIGARLDLHGMTQARAHRALLAFLQQSQADGCRYVLVITGKGKTTAGGAERGVLRRMVPEWLALAEFRALVTAYEEAAIGHGGEGALYVRVRRG